MAPIRRWTSADLRELRRNQSEQEQSERERMREEAKRKAQAIDLKVKAFESGEPSRYRGPLSTIDRKLDLRSEGANEAVTSASQDRSSNPSDRDRVCHACGSRLDNASSGEQDR
jgi:hypothetical protein